MLTYLYSYLDEFLFVIANLLNNHVWISQIKSLCLASLSKFELKILLLPFKFATITGGALNAHMHLGYAEYDW